MNRSARRRCRLIALFISFFLLVSGVVLMLVGGISMFRVPFEEAKTDGLADTRGPMNRFLACNEQSARYAAFGSGLGKAANIRCIVAQAPYAFVFVVTAAFLLVAGVLAMLSALKGVPGSVYSFPIVAAITMVLMLLSVYVFLELIRPLTMLVPCKGLSDLQVRALTKAKFGTCVTTTDGEKKGSAFWLFNMLLVWAVGWFVSFIALCILMGLMSGVASRLMIHGDSLDDKPPNWISTQIPTAHFSGTPFSTTPVGVEMYQRELGAPARSQATPQYAQTTTYSQYPMVPRYQGPQQSAEPPQQLYYPYPETAPRQQSTVSQQPPRPLTELEYPLR